MNLDQRTIEILAQVCYKEACEDGRKHNYSRLGESRKAFFEDVKEDTLELARTIIRVNRIINP